MTRSTTTIATGAATCVMTLALATCLADKSEVNDFGKECLTSDECAGDFVCDPVQTICVPPGDDVVPVEDEATILQAFCDLRARCSIPDDANCVEAFTGGSNNANMNTPSVLLTVRCTAFDSWFVSETSAPGSTPP